MEELKKLLEKQNKAFEKFKKANDERLESLEKTGNVDPLLVEKVEKANEHITELSKQIEKLEKELNRTKIGSNDSKTKEQEEYEKAFKSFLIKGDEIEIKALQTGVNIDGGYAVPEELSRSVYKKMNDLSPMRGLVNVITIGTSDYKMLVDVKGTGAGWVGETASRTETDSPQLEQVSAVMGEVYANPAATQTALDDMFFDAELWLTNSIAEKFAEMEDYAILKGTGTNQPKGILSYTQSLSGDSDRTFGEIQYISANSSSAISFDDIINLIYSMRAVYRQNAKFLTNSATLASLRKLKDSNNNYLWTPSTVAGQSAQIFGYGIVEDENVDDISSGNVPMLFGDFKKAYLLLDRMDMRILRDPYSYKPYIMFYSTKRVGSMLVDDDAIKLLKN